ncbi:ribosomal-processing cysteine protease Prp [Fusobacterium sp. PH5-44]|uniref:ribosomal-processing cysteine protease Prp n=1 Tax=unclassified Fusobacterium TaxID=2648384 RepID=UPI003D2624C3
MVLIEIFRKNGKVVGYKGSGHSGYEEIGKDIVCAAISVILQNPLGGMEVFLGINPEYSVNSDGHLEVDILKSNLQGKEKETEVLLETMVIMIKSLVDQYPNNLKLVEREVK